MTPIDLGGYTTLVDDDLALPFGCEFKPLTRAKGYTYAMVRSPGGPWRLLHHVVMGLPGERGHIVDHRNGNTLDNRRDNLRLCTRSQNQMNRRGHGPLGLKNVVFDSERQSWRVRLYVNRQAIQGGRFKCLADAVKRANELMLVHHGEFARLNP